MKVGIDNYGLTPLNLDVFETLKWAADHGAQGVAFSGIANRREEKYDPGLLRELKSKASLLDLYLEWGGGQHLPWDIADNKPKEILEFNIRVAEEAAELEAQIVRSCSGGLMRWNSTGPSTGEYLDAMGKQLKLLKPILKDLGIFWAIETHFEFTSFELVRLFEKHSFYPGEEIGICLDTMNLLTMLEDPMDATLRLSPWIVSTHIKDGGLIKNTKGFQSFPTGINDGWICIDQIVRHLHEMHPDLNLNVEDHNGSFELPILNAAFRNEFPDLGEFELSKLDDLASLSESSRDRIKTDFQDREIWPEICEQRMIRDIVELKKIRDSINDG